MSFDLHAITHTCERCPGHHPTDLHLAVKRAASVIGRDLGIPVAAHRSGLSEAQLAVWLESDSRFKWLVARARLRALKRQARHTRDVILQHLQLPSVP